MVNSFKLFSLLIGVFGIALAFSMEETGQKTTSKERQSSSSKGTQEVEPPRKRARTESRESMRLANEITQSLGTPLTDRSQLDLPKLELPQASEDPPPAADDDPAASSQTQPAGSNIPQIVIQPPSSPGAGASSAAALPSISQALLADQDKFPEIPERGPKLEPFNFDPSVPGSQAKKYNPIRRGRRRNTS